MRRSLKQVSFSGRYIILSSLFSGMNAQPSEDKGEENVKRLKNTTLIAVVPEGDLSSYQKFRESVKKFWTFNEYRFVTPMEVKPYYTDPSCSVLALSTQMFKYNMFSYTPWGMDVSGNNRKFEGRWVLRLVLGHAHAKEKGLFIGEAGFKIRETELGSFDHMISHNIKTLHNEMVDRYHNLPKIEYGVRGIKTVEGTIAYYNEGKEHAGKTLLLNSEGADAKFDKQKFCASFGFKEEQVRIVSKEEISSAVESGDADTNYAWEFSNAYTLIYSAKDSRVVMGTNYGKVN